MLMTDVSYNPCPQNDGSLAFPVTPAQEFSPNYLSRVPIQTCGLALLSF